MDPACINIEAGKVGLAINVKKTKALRVNTSKTESFILGSESIEDVDSFVYLGSKVTKDGGAAQDVAQRIQKANGAFVQLYPNTLYITIIFCCKNIRSSQRF